MNPFDRLDAEFAKQFGGLPQIEPPVPLAPELSIMPMKEISMGEFEAMYSPNSDGPPSDKPEQHHRPIHPTPLPCLPSRVPRLAGSTTRHSSNPGEHAWTSTSNHLDSPKKSCRSA